MHSMKKTVYISLVVFLLASQTFKVSECVADSVNRLPARAYRDVTVLTILNEVGRDADCKLAIVDRFCRASDGGQMAYELSTLKTTVELPAGTMEDQLRALEANVLLLKWEKESGIFWVQNNRLAENIPLHTPVKHVSYDGPLIGLAPTLNSHDKRISEFYMFESQFQITAGRTPIHVNVDHGSIRSVLSQALRVSKSKGVLLRFVGVVPATCGPHPNDENAAPDAFFWQVMTNL